MTWLIENYEAVVAFLLAAHAAALVIVNLTPTPKDNEVLAKVYKVIQVAAGLVTKKATDATPKQ